MESRGPEDSKNVKSSQAYFFEGFISFFEDFSLTIMDCMNRVYLFLIPEQKRCVNTLLNIKRILMKCEVMDINHTHLDMISIITRLSWSA